MSYLDLVPPKQIKMKGIPSKVENWHQYTSRPPTPPSANSCGLPKKRGGFVYERYLARELRAKISFYFPAAKGGKNIVSRRKFLLKTAQRAFSA